MAKSIVKKITGKSNSIFEEVDDFFQHNYDIETKQDLPFPGLAETIIKGYEAANKEKEEQKKGFSPSALVYGHGVCPRFWYLAFEDKRIWKRNNDGLSIANMDSGTDRHERIQAAMQDAGVLISSEVWTETTDPPIRAKVDCFLNWEDEEYIGEIKTKNDEGYKAIVKTMKPSTYNVLQLLIYMKVYKKKKGMLIYENKNTHELLILPVNINKNHVDFVDYMFDWMREVWAAYQNRKLPEIPFRGGKQIKMCDTCPLKDACSNAPAGDIKIARRKDEKGQF